MAAQHTIGIDLGGTYIKAGILNAGGKLVHRTSITTEAEFGFDHVFARLVDLVDILLRDAKLERSAIAGIGFGTPGPMTRSLGVIHAMPNLPGWENVPLRDKFREATGIPVTLENDANAAAFGEFVAGAGRDVRNMVMLTLGTGVGGGVIINGELQRGAMDNAGEVGHMITVPNGRKCPCGQRGCLERYSSAQAVADRLVEAVGAGEDLALPSSGGSTSAGRGSSLRAAIDDGQDITSTDVVRAATEGDALAAQIWDETAMYLAIACVNLQHLLNPERIVFAGGLINAGDKLLTPVRTHFEQQTWRIAKDQPQLELATLAGDAGLIGAAALARVAGE